MSDEIFDGLAVVMAHPDDEILWASSVLRRAEAIVLVYRDLPCNPSMGTGRTEAMAAFPLETLDWLEMTESGVFDSASWPEPKETEYGLYPHRMLGLLESFDPDRYRRQFDMLRDALRERLAGKRNVVVHGPWGEYGHEDHVQVFRAVASLSDEIGFQVWVPGYFAAKSEALMRRNLKYLGAPTGPMPTDRALAAEMEDAYKRTGTWTWFDDYVWPEEEWFFPWSRAPVEESKRVSAAAVQRIVFPSEPFRMGGWRGALRDAKGAALAWLNRRGAR